MRVVFVSDHFSTPDEPGILRTWQLSRHLCEAGDTVTVVAPKSHYLFGPAAAPAGRSLPEGLRLVHMRASDLDRTSSASRVRHYALQLVSGTVEAWRSGRPDVVVAGLTPSLLGVGPYLVARLRGVPFVLEERDLSLMAAEEMGLLPGPVIAAARAIQRAVFRWSDAIVAVTPGLERLLVADGVPHSKISMIPNGYEDLPADPGAQAAVREELRRDGRTVLLYAGGLGQMYDLDLVLDALHLLPKERFLLAIMGEGERKAGYERRARDEGLPVRFLAPRPKRAVSAVCAAADVGLLPLVPISRSACVIGNKVFDYLGAGLPVVATGPGDTADLLDRAGAGIAVPAGDAHAMAEALARLAEDPRLASSMGEAGRRFVEATWRRDQFVPLFREVLETVTGTGQRTRERELARIRYAYRRYDSTPRERRKRDPRDPGTALVARDRWAAIRDAVLRVDLPDRPAILDVGCGAGGDLAGIGALVESLRPRLFGIDLLPDRVERAREAVPAAEVIDGSADRLPFDDGTFDLVVASTLFSSVLDDGLARAIADEILRVLAPGGTLLCYDVRYPNPRNPSTRPVTGAVLRRLFPSARISVRPVTLLPPLARAVGRLAPAVHGPLRRVRLLRSHQVALVRHEPAPAPDTARSLLAVVPVNCRFPNMAVNQRLRALSDHGPVEVWTCYPESLPGDVASRVRVRSFPLSRSIRRTTPKLAAFTAEAVASAAVRRLRGRRPAVVYCFQDTSAAAGLVLRGGGCRWVVDALDDPAQSLFNARVAGRRLMAAALAARDRVIGPLLRRADLVCTVGWDAGDPLPTTLARGYSVDPSRILPLNQSIELASAPAHPFPTGVLPPRVLFVGYLSPARGVDTLIAAADAVAKEGVELELRLVGHVKDRAWLRRAIESAAAPVRYLGVLPSERVQDEIRRAWVGVLPFPRARDMAPVQAVTGLEYLAGGRPIVATDLEGARSLVEDGVNGFLVPPGDAEAMAKGISAILSDPQRAVAMGGESRRRARLFDAGPVGERLREALRRPG
jgi:glycosyltransferase involved in cell wall biosynthesis